MAKYRKKPVGIESHQFNDKYFREAPKEFCNAVDVYQYTIKTLEGDMDVQDGDFVIKGVNGEFYPCKPDIFHKTYEKVV